MKFRHSILRDMKTKGKQPQWGKWQGAGFTGEELQSRWQEMGILGGDLGQSHCSVLFVPPEGHLAAGGERPTSHQTEGVCVLTQLGFRNGPFFSFSVAFHTVTSFLTNKQWLQTASNINFNSKSHLCN